jgi:peroxiredoxin
MPRKSRRLKPGDKAPDFALEDAATGKLVALRDLLGRPLLLVFLRGTW